MRQVLIGADGGGTKTAYVCVDALTGQTVASSVTDGIHLSADGEAAVYGALRRGIEGLCLSENDRVVGFGIGDPAIDDSNSDPEAGESLRALARRLLPDVPCFSKSDVFMALYAFTGGAPGALLVAGTGSMGVCLPRPYKQGEMTEVLTVGGWGVPTNDPGSGYDIAVRGVCAAIDAFDGVGEKTALCDAVLAYFGADSPRALIGLLNDGSVPRARMAGFARQVDACAAAGDEAAQRILERAGNVLGRYACAMLETGVRDVGIYGSVLLHNRTVRRCFEEKVYARFSDARITVLQTAPEYGAVCFAADCLGIDRGGWL